MDSPTVTLVAAAIGFALSPAALIELILVLFSQRRIVNAMAFIVTIVAGAAAVVLVGALGGRASGGSGPRSTSTLMALLLLGLGVVLLAVGVRNWRNRRDTSEPRVFSTISGMGPGSVAFLAVGVVAVNPKNTVLLLAAGQAVGQTSARLLSGILFLLVACLPYFAAVGYALLGGEGAADRLDRARMWLVAHNRVVMAVVCLVLGAVLIVKGAGALL